MSKIEDFFRFEINNRLFEIIDDDGHRPWEAIRFYVCCRVVNSFGMPHQLETHSRPFLKRLCVHTFRILSDVVYIFRHRHCPYMFMINSRDKKDGFYYDKICGGLYDLVDKSKTFTIETNWPPTNYQYESYACSNELYSLLSVLFNKRYFFNFNQINTMLKKNYPDLNMSVDEMNFYYNAFKIQYRFYKSLYRYCGTKRMFMVQNGIQKGLLAAAKECGVEVFELQHGQINKNHSAYSYPNCDELNAEMIYHPSYLLTFGTFWHKNRHYPGVENIVIGNDSYTERISISERKQSKHILVISNMDDGQMLFDFVKDIQRIDQEYYFYFKLHPNQYNEKEHFCSITREYCNIEVLTNEYTINHLLSKVDAVLLVQSTVELEALRMGRRVYIIKKGAYKNMEFVFDEKGVTLINDAKEFVDIYKENEKDCLPPREDLFSPFNIEIAQNFFEL